MFVLGDKGHYYGRFPWVTMWLVIINVVVFTAQLIIGESLTNGLSMVPLEITTFHDIQGPVQRKVKVETGGYRDSQGHYQAQYVTRDIQIKHYPGPVPIFLTLFTSMFMHGSVMHLVFNMWFLLIFGRNVECALGHKLFLGLYLACGILAGLAHVASDPNSIIPCLGASGAIAGVMGAYVSIHPTNNIKLWFGLPWVTEAPALAVIGIWALLQYLSAVVTDNKAGGVAYWAHLGGFFAGIIGIRVIVIYLQLTVSATPATTKEKPVVPAAQFDAAIMSKPSNVESGVADPYAGFITVQTMRRMQEKKQQENPAV